VGLSALRWCVECPVPDRDDDSLSAKKPSRLEELNTSEVVELERILRLESWTLGVVDARKRGLGAGVCRGVASLDERLRGSVVSSGDGCLLGCLVST